MKCPTCGTDLDPGFLYVRGLGGALYWSPQKDTRFWSRKRLEQMNLRAISVIPTRMQAIVEASRCPRCKTVAFRSTR